MPDENVSSPPLPTPRSKPVSEALLNEKHSAVCISSQSDDWFQARDVNNKSDANKIKQWDRAISDTVIKSGLGFSFGVIFSVLLFKRRAWPVWFGTGFGAGRAWEAADANFKRGDSTDGLRKVRTER